MIDEFFDMAWLQVLFKSILTQKCYLKPGSLPLTNNFTWSDFKILSNWSVLDLKRYFFLFKNDNKKAIISQVVIKPSHCYMQPLYKPSSHKLCVNVIHVIKLLFAFETVKTGFHSVRIDLGIFFSLKRWNKTTDS